MRIMYVFRAYYWFMISAIRIVGVLACESGMREEQQKKISEKENVIAENALYEDFYEQLLEEGASCNEDCRRPQRRKPYSSAKR